MIFPPVVGRKEVEKRLHEIFPRSAFDSAMSAPIAASGIAAMIYAGSLVPHAEDVPDDGRWISPTRCLWMNDVTLTHDEPDEREAWYRAATSHTGRKNVIALLDSWGHPFTPWYGDNSREGWRDEALKQYRLRGAVRYRPGLNTTSGVNRWALDEQFASLFDPAVTGGDLTAKIEDWRGNNLAPLEQLRVQVQSRLEKSVGAVLVTLPQDQTVRQLEPGLSSEILRGVVEEWAPARLDRPFVVAISEPGNKQHLADSALMAAAGISINVSDLLPDALIVDIGGQSPTFWIVEAVATDGEIDEARKAELLQWAATQKIPTGACQFLTAFASRRAAPAKRRLADLAAGSYAWFLDEPTHQLAWSAIR